ncbi:hypothetical protein EDB19DRAFT_1896846 [Suillus lakei]|nr:hypothetical protein EDB19DRAFT_1896846 [Suillus lakei]
MTLHGTYWEYHQQFHDGKHLKRTIVIGPSMVQAAAAGNGLFARTSCPPSSLLFAVPPQALMNLRTLKSLHPTSGPTPLTATQMISLHLCINHPHESEDSLDPHYGPYISTLPREFDSHPLTWIVRSSSAMESGGVPLLGYLPPSVHASLVELHDRFCQDWAAVRAYLVGNTQYYTRNYLWAWLNVNTRCIYYRLKASKEDPDNLTLCPILDFANHAPNGLHMTPVPSEADIWDTAPIKSIGKGFRRAKEIFLTYGVHPNRTLFVEYGFVNKSSDDAEITDGEVDVQDVVESLILDHKSGVFVKSVLEDEGYWGDWTLYCSAKSAQPSWRLITALRLHGLVASFESDGAEYGHGGSDGWLPWMRENIRTLWREELLVATAVKQRMLRGDDY